MRAGLIVMAIVAIGTLSAYGASARNCAAYDKVQNDSAQTVVSVAETEAPAVVAQYHKITAEAAKERMDSGDPVTIVDVRTQAEYDSGHIPGAILVVNEEIGTETEMLLPDKDAELLVYCRSGRRSQEASEKLVEMGYTAVYDFGGIIDWPYEIEY